MEQKVRKFSEFTDKQKEYFLNYYKNHLLGGTFGFKWQEPNKEFDNNGLKFSVEYLNDLGLNNIFLPLEYMAEYADIVTVKAMQENSITFQKTALSSLILDNSNEINLDQLNATGIGNLAYVYLHTTDEQLKYETLLFLNKLLKIHIGKFADLINDTAG